MQGELFMLKILAGDEKSTRCANQSTERSSGISGQSMKNPCHGNSGTQ
jgi:hypothetical protein